MSNKNLRGEQSKPWWKKRPYPCLLAPLCYLPQGACWQTNTVYCQQNLPGEVRGPLSPRGAMDLGCLGPVGEMGPCSENSSGHHWHLGGQRQGLGGQQGAWEPPGSWLPLAHLQEAGEGYQLRPTEPGGGAARGWDGEDPGRHYWGWEQQFESPSPAEGPETGAGEHAAHRTVEGQKERGLHSVSLGTLHPWVPALHSDVLLDGPEASA